jgi:hypothetical protein
LGAAEAVMASQYTPLLELIAAGSRLQVVADLVQNRRINHILGMVGCLGCPVPEGRSGREKHQARAVGQLRHKFNVLEQAEASPTKREIKAAMPYFLPARQLTTIITNRIMSAG